VRWGERLSPAISTTLAADQVESDMTQPAKAQEPSMEEILASIRRIISDDEAKPAAAAAPSPVKAEAPKADIPRPESVKPETMKPEVKPGIVKPGPSGKAVMAGIPPSKIVPARPAPAAAAKNNQDDIDAMMAGFDTPAAPPQAEPEDADADVFELTEQMALPDAAAFRTVAPDDDLDIVEAPVAQAEPRVRPVEPPAFREPAPPEMPHQQMISNSTATAVESAFNALATTVLSNNARTLEDLVKEMLRPMLKSWLDDNLPNLVERIVKAEIERVSRGR
jgi:cell pole-organizing protein PopZ